METKKEQNVPVKIRQGRSPAYPFFSLVKAVERAEEINSAGGARAEMPPETFYNIWGYGAKSSGARQTMAAMNQYGLVAYVGRGNVRKVVLTELARQIVLDKTPNSVARANAIRTAALEPEIHKELLKQFGHILPSNIVIESWLQRDMKYNSQAAKSIVDEYRDTFSYAGLGQPDNITNENATIPLDDGGYSQKQQEIAIGDYIQWEVGGVLQLDTPRQVRAIQKHEGSDWVFVNGSETGIPMNEVILESKGAASPKAPPVLAEDMLDDRKKGMKREVKGLDEGEAVLSWPKELSPESYYDLEYWIEGILRTARRRAGLPEKKSTKIE